jgi:DNA polymerase-3 subunit beta
VIDVLKSIDDEEIKMLFNTGITPCLIQPVEGNEFEYLVLPVRIN